MVNQNFTTRPDPKIRALAECVAETERRSLTSLLEVAVLEYAENRGFILTEGNTDE